MIGTAGLHSGSGVLEVGCGTGQLTGQLATYGFRFTAIDLGTSMVATARRQVLRH
jgi:2-polyprenyl-3-methyl-5-hydroxy-6-metoxy-1,4-benzoquinol methylase